MCDALAQCQCDFFHSSPRGTNWSAQKGGEKRRLNAARPSEIWGPPPASPRTEPASRAEKTGDKGREILDHAITGPPSPSTPVPSSFPPPSTSWRTLETINYVSGTGVGATTSECRRRGATLWWASAVACDRRVVDMIRQNATSI